MSPSNASDKRASWLAVCSETARNGKPMTSLEVAEFERQKAEQRARDEQRMLNRGPR